MKLLTVDEMKRLERIAEVNRYLLYLDDREDIIERWIIMLRGKSTPEIIALFIEMADNHIIEQVYEESQGEIA